MTLEPILFVPDCHRPYHSQQGWELLLQVGKWLKPKHLIVLGDFCDFYAISKYDKDPIRATKLPEELESVQMGLKELGELGATHRVFLLGNHEDRLRRYLQVKAPELFGIVSIPQLFHLAEQGWKCISYKQDYRLGKLYITHDVGNSGRYGTYHVLDAYQHSVVTAHLHRLSYVVEGNAVGEYKVGAQFGWLGDVEAVDYMHRIKARRNWTLGFGVGYLNPKTGTVYVQPVPIIKGTCVVGGKGFEA